MGSERLLKKVTKTFVVSGSTTGHIYLWDISSCFQSDSHEISQIGSFEAHQMGTNTLTIDEIPVPSEQQTDREELHLLRICSGGDDQGLTLAFVLLRWRGQQVAEVISCHIERVIGASGSAIKGVVIHPDWPQYLFTVGYDQRLTQWAFISSRVYVKSKSSTESPAAITLPTMLSHILPKNFFIPERRSTSMSPANDCTGTTEVVYSYKKVNANESSLSWCSSRLVDIGDIEGLALDTTRRRSFEEKPTIQLVVYGQGIQLCEWRI